MTGDAIAAVLWDMDGTLIDSEPTWIDAQTRLVGEYGGTWNYNDGLTLVGADMEVTARSLQDRGVLLPADAIISRLTAEVTAALGRSIAWRPGATALVERVRDAGIPQAIVTTSPSTMAQVVADALPTGAISTIVAAEHVRAGKPNPEPYLLAARLLGVDARRCVALEDSPTGLASAIAAGTVAVGIPNDAILNNPGRWFRLDTLNGVTLDGLARLARSVASATPDGAPTEAR